MDANLMEAKKTSHSSIASSQKDAPPSSVKVGQFVGEVKEEVWRITWPSAEELRSYTKIVIGMTFALGLGIYFSDLVIQSTLHGLSTVIRWIAG